jgi:GH25 family lysozyme M1 (1,4-beta-N-acetylmuramidase)
MRSLRFRIILAAFVVLAIVGVLLPGGSDRTPLPKLGQPRTEKNIDKAQDAAVERCKLSTAEARERKVVNGKPGVQPAVDHDMGDCAPGSIEPKSSVTGGTSLGCDRSNNNPINGVSTWNHIRSLGFSYCWFKTSEGATYRDPTVERMAGDARSAGLLVGGYHFAHPCLTSSIAEANLFIAKLRSAHLDTPDSARPVLDVEYGGCASGSATNVWIRSVYDRVQTATGQRLGVYSGNWWLAPHTDCLFAHLPKDTLSWISGYPSADAPCGHALQVHQYTSSGDHGLSGDINRLVHATFADLFGKGRPAAPKEAVHQCRMHSKYVAWFHQYTARRLERHKRGHELDQFGQRRLNSATSHLYGIRHYFTKNHEHGRANYDCHPDGTVTVREVKAKSVNPSSAEAEAPRAHVGLGALPHRGRPRPGPLADRPLHRHRHRRGDGELGLPRRGCCFDPALVRAAHAGGAVRHAACGDRQPARLLDTRGSLGRCRVSGPTGLQARDLADRLRRERLRRARRHPPRRALRLDPVSALPAGVEFHHLTCSRARPAGELRDKIRARRERLPTHC